MTAHPHDGSRSVPRVVQPGPHHPALAVLDRVGRSTTRLTIDDVGEVLGDALRDQRKLLLQHIDRLFRQQLSGGAAKNDQRYRNLHRRLTEVEAEIRALKRGGAR